MIDTEFRPKQRKNEIRFRHSVIASSKVALIGEKE